MIYSCKHGRSTVPCYKCQIRAERIIKTAILALLIGFAFLAYVLIEEFAR